MNQKTEKWFRSLTFTNETRKTATHLYFDVGNEYFQNSNYGLEIPESNAIA